MSIITKMLRQKAVYWAPKSRDAYGQWVYEVPVEIKCRWEDKAQEYLDQNGETKVSNCVVYVDRDVEVGGKLMLGELEDAPVDLQDQSDVFEIKRFDKLPNLKATEMLRTVYC